ncbi:MAG: DUF5683 domain-containing protein [Bacteroidales bacterium]|nr:DUF5683 domain-containing protein [Bacteroidales bacterium]MDD4654087.1 DUF5683 domain-containing protein [Bacteroidales bacterium]
MRRSLLFCLFFLVSLTIVRAQFALDMGAQGTAASDTSVTARAPFKLSTYFTALAGKDSLTIARMVTGGIVLPGYTQAYNRQYWKIPVVFAGMGTGIYMGYRYNLKYLSTENESYMLYRNLCYLGAGLFYWGSLLDGVANFKYDKPVLPARATLYSALLPGLGQMYNGDYWKLPIIYGGLMSCGYFLQYNQMQYKRYKTMYNHATAKPSEYDGWMTAENIKWYRDTFRRYRDYSIIATVIVYALNVIDANVFAHFQDFDVSDDLSLRIEPGIITPITTNYAASSVSGVGMQMRLTF